MDHRILIAAMMSAMALSGCLSDTTDAGTDSVAMEDGSTLNAAGRPVWVLDSEGNIVDAAGFEAELPVFDQRFVSNRRSGEPSLGVTSSGALFYASIEFDATVLPRTIYYRSYDAGLTWDDVTPDLAGEVPTHPQTGDPYLYVDPATDRVFAMDMGPHVSCNTVSWSDDDGDSWSPPRVVCPTPVSDHPTLFTGPRAGPAFEVYNAVETALDPDGDVCFVVDLADDCPSNPLYENVVYLCSNQVAQVKCEYSLDGGYTWGSTQLVSQGVAEDSADRPEYVTDCVTIPPEEGDPFSIFQSSGEACLDNVCSGHIGHGATDKTDGTVYLGRSMCTIPYISISHDGGLSYIYKPITTDSMHRTLDASDDINIAVDSDGTVYAMWIGGNGTTVNMVISEDQGETWGEIKDLTPPGITAAKLPDIIAGEDGRIAFLFIGTENERGHYVHTDLYEEDGSENETNYPIWLDATWNAYIGVSIDADSSDGTFAITMVNDPADPLKRGGCWDRCFGDDGGMYDFLDIDIDPVTGQIFAALVDVCNNACEEDPAATAEYYQRATGDVGVQLSGPTLWDGTEADR